MPNPKSNTKGNTKAYDGIRDDIRRKLGKGNPTLFSVLKIVANTKRGDLKNLLSKIEVPKFTSNLFEKTITLRVFKSPNDFVITEENVRNFLQSVTEREQKLGNPEFWIDNDIWNWDCFKNKVIAGIKKSFFFNIYRFLQNLTHGQILEEAEDKGIKKIYSFIEALSVIRAAVLAGEVDKKGTGIIVYFKIGDDGPLCRFCAYRYDDGELDLDVNEVNLGSG